MVVPPERTLTSVRIFTETTSFPEVPPCTQVLLTECKRKSPVLLHPPSRSLLHQRENTLSGSEVPSLLPSPHSKPCGSPSKTTMKLVHPSSTENASKFSLFSFTLFQFMFPLTNRIEYNLSYLLNLLLSSFS